VSRIYPPAKNPCGSCPYRRDVPSGVWSEEEYEKLPTFDGPTFEQPPSVFLCHQQDGRLCAGWTAVHDMDESMGLRIACSTERITPEDMDAIRDYTTTTPLFASGAEAAAHGMEEVFTPGEDAAKVIRKLKRRIG
jgi:hypothetical protein